MSGNEATFAEKQREANRIESQFDTLKEMATSPDSTGLFNDDEIAGMRAEMAELSSQYVQLTGLTLE